MKPFSCSRNLFVVTIDKPVWEIIHHDGKGNFAKTVVDVKTMKLPQECGPDCVVRVAKRIFPRNLLPIGIELPDTVENAVVFFHLPLKDGIPGVNNTTEITPTIMRVLIRNIPEAIYETPFEVFLRRKRERK